MSLKIIPLLQTISSEIFRLFVARYVVPLHPQSFLSSYMSYLSKVADFYPHLRWYYGSCRLCVCMHACVHACVCGHVRDDLFEFHQDLKALESYSPGLSRGVVCVILHLALSIEHRLVTDR